MKTKFNFKKVLKNITIVTLCIASITSAILASTPVAYANSSGILNTNIALGSPVLNKNFVIDDWNEWEMEVWGVYLSNFCQPLIDKYETAFKTGAGGSNGAGYKAICFGSGSDPENNEVIQQLCDDAIVYQQTVTKRLYVTYTHVKYELRQGDINYVDSGNGGAVETWYERVIDDTKSDANTNEPREATFKDLFFQNNALEGATSSAKIKDAGSFSGDVYKFNDNYTWTMHIDEAYIPTFWIRNEKGKYIKVLDYMDSWDIQLTSLLLASMRQSEQKDAFKKKFEDLFDGNCRIVMDAFGNITTDDKLMIIPAAINPNLTKTKQINLLCSWIFNTYISTYSDDDIIKDLKQYNYMFNTGGFPAFSEAQKVKGVALLYYDMDNVMIQDSYPNFSTRASESTVNYGKSLINFFETDINSSQNKYQLKIEVAGLDESYHMGIFSNLDEFKEHSVLASVLSNELKKDIVKTEPKMLHELICTNGQPQSIFSVDPVIIAPQMKNKEDAEGIRLFYNFIYEVYCGKYGDNNKKGLKDKLETNCVSFDDFTRYLDFLWDDFIKIYPKYKGKNWDSQWLDWGDNETVNEDGNRLCKVYPVSTVMRDVGRIMALADGAEFNTYCTMIYATYLDWYGIGQSNLIGVKENKSEFNPEIFDGESDIPNYDPAPNLNLKTQEDKEEEILNLGYLMLSPEEGREYRKNLIYNGFEDFIYEQYNRIVYGGKDSMYSGTASKSNSGFLAIETFDNNPLTSWFLDSYTNIVIIALVGIILIIIIVGLLKKRKLSWYFINIVIAINVILLVPSSGEIVPYVTSNFIQNMFDSKMTYWSMSEGITNNEIESNIKITDEKNADIILSLVKTLNVVYTDRSLMLKQDISQKLTQKTGGIYSELQNIKSARWLLPIVMQQFTGDNSTTNYLYIKLSNAWDDMSNLYWYYNPGDAESVTKITQTSGQIDKANTSTGIGSVQLDNTSYDNLKRQFEDFKEIDVNNRQNNYNYRCYSYSENGDLKNQVHLYSYALDSNKHLNLSIPSRGYVVSNYEDSDSWQAYIETANASRVSYEAVLNTSKDDGFESVADKYDRTDRSTLDGDYSYLKTTESPMYYFFNTVKDSFGSSVSVGADGGTNIGTVIGRLQGGVEEGIDGEDVRTSFMHATITDDITGDILENRKDLAKYTPYVRDILDLENMFTNTIPYLYQIQLITGGFDGKSGVLGDSKINDLQFYSGELQSWLYRCNWATKIMENPEFSKPCKIRLADGTTVIVSNPLLPECYIAKGRPMIFSEAQMHAYGLVEADLSIVELKCIEVNKDTCNKWTLLINYAGTSGITKEIMFRQMATDATMIFNEEFSTSGVLNNMYHLYPTSIDLRYLSFDSVMKMLMLNVSKNTSYVYGDTMQTLISDSDIFTAVLLLIDAFVCASIVPLARNILLAMIFYLGFLAIIRSIFSDGKHKAKIACGQLVSNLLFMVYTLIYYACFCGLMAITSSDEVLSVKQIKSTPGNPIWVLIAILLFSCIYVYAMYRQIKFCALNYKDMGAEVYSMVAQSATDRLQNGLANISSGLQSWASGFAGDDGGSSGTSNTNSIKGTGTMNKATQDVNLKSTDKNSVKLEQSDEKDESFEDLSQQSYQTSSDNEYIETTTSDDINAEIQAGKDK